MRHRLRLTLVGLLLSVAGCHGRSASIAAGDPAGEVHAAYLRDLDTLSAAVGRLDGAVAHADSGAAAVAELRRAFVAARMAYKRVEHLVEFFNPTTADGINGPALDDMAQDDPNRIVLPPEGFQVVEEYLYPEPSLSDREALRTEVRILLANVERVRHGAAATPLTSASVFDAMRLQVVRIVSLGISGFDSPVALHSLAEGAQSVQALRATAARWRPALRRADAALADSLDARFARAERLLRMAADFDGFDRLQFIVEGANPLSAALLDAQQALGVPMPTVTRAWRPAAATVFDEDAFEPLHFGPAGQDAPPAAVVALGRELFFDPVLSRDGARACASCHRPDRGFADGMPRSLPAREGAPPRRNAPTVLNAALQNGTFHDLRTTFLEDQVADVVRNRDEMHGSLEEAVAEVFRREAYAERFREAFRERAPTGREAQVRLALAAYLRSLNGLDSRFDRYVRGDRRALTAGERSGFNVFMGKGRCGTCHFAPLFNGALPPAYAKTESEVLGVPAAPVASGAVVDPDLGRFAITGLPIHRHAFKTPTVRNVALTAPYMHNGVYRTLEEVVDFYDAGGGAGIGIDLPNQTLPPDSLHLTAAEKRDLVAFMGALTDTSGLTGRPARASDARGVRAPPARRARADSASAGSGS